MCENHLVFLSSYLQHVRPKQIPSLKQFRVSCKKNISITTSISSLKFHNWNKVISSNVVLCHNIHCSRLDNVPFRDFLGFLLDVLLCNCNCHLRAFSELEVTDTRNLILRILVPFHGWRLIIVTASCCERVFLTCHLTDITTFFRLLSTTWILSAKLARNASLFADCNSESPILHCVPGPECLTVEH